MKKYDMGSLIKELKELKNKKIINIQCDGMKMFKKINYNKI